MSFNSSNFREALGSGSRANLFRVEISGATSNTVPTSLSSTFTHMCKAASLPASTTGIIEIPFNGGRRYKFAGERTFAEWTTTIINTEDFVIRDFLETWQKDLVGINYEEVDMGDRNSTRLRDVSLLVSQLNDAGDIVVQYKLHHCWPSDISTIDLSYDNTDALEEFTVTWTYDYYTQTEGVQNVFAAANTAG